MSRARQAMRKEKQKEHALTKAATERARASRRKSLMRIGRGTLATVAVAVAGVLAATGVSDVAGSSGQPPSARVEKDVSALLSGIPRSGDTLGETSAPITLQIFGDLESADVRTFVVWLLPDIIREWVRTNIVKIQYRSFMTTSSPYPNVFVTQQAAALSAGVQDRLWNFIELFYYEQGQEHTRYVTDAHLDGIAGQIPGLDLSEWESDRESSQLTRQVIEDDHVARAVFHDAPAFVIGRIGGKLAPWQGYRLYEEPGLKPHSIKRPAHPVSFITSKTLRSAIEQLHP